MPALWKDVIGFEGRYQVSNKGEVKSVARLVNRYHKGMFRDRIPVKERILTPWVSSGRLHVRLDDGINKSIHRLVARVFCEGYAPLLVVNHVDSNPFNNNSENLEWCTQKENMVHGSKYGKVVTGEKSKASKLSNIQADFIKYWSSMGYKQKDIALEFGVNPSQVSRIVNNLRRLNQYKETV